MYYFDDYVCLLLIDGMHVSLMYFLMKLKETLSSVQEVLAITSVLVDTIKRNLKDFAFNGTFYCKFSALLLVSLYHSLYQMSTGR